MLIQCSQCSAKYAVPDQSIGIGGRTVRCAKCGHSWFVTHPAQVPLAAEPASTVESNRPNPIPPGSNLPVIKRPSVPFGAKASVFGLLAAAIALMLLWLAPQTYGYPHSAGFGLAEVNMLSRLDDKHPENKQPIYEVSGKILNLADKTLTVPILRVTVVDKDGTALQYWDYSEKGATLEPGKNIPFTTGPLDIKFKKAARFVVELGSEMELSLRKKPDA
jgi:predicted Zn finger-like uncharacterized protein